MSTNAGASAIPSLPALEHRLRAFKTALVRADKSALTRNPDSANQGCARAAAAFGELVDQISTDLGRGGLDESACTLLGAELQSELLPYVTLSGCADRFYAKPRGFAGDFETIAQIYANRPTGAGRMGPVMDACFLGSRPARAVRNRRGLLVEEILRVVQACGQAPARITSLACGPAEEMFDAFAACPDACRIEATGCDFDLQALANVALRRDAAGFGDNLRLVHGDLVRLSSGRDPLQLPPQDLVYSIGLIDYFGDRLVIRLINMAHDLLRPGGRLVLGNFHVDNPDRAFMDHVLEWRLLHRSEADMHRLFRASTFGRDADSIRFEAEGINMFASCVRTSSLAAASRDDGRRT